MSKRNGANPQVHVSVFFCQDVIRESGILTAIRISDAFITDPAGVDKAEDGTELKMYGPSPQPARFFYRHGRKALSLRFGAVVRSPRLPRAPQIHGARLALPNARRSAMKTGIRLGIPRRSGLCSAADERSRNLGQTIPQSPRRILDHRHKAS